MMKKLLYFADPMCSWCWGFQPVMDEIVDHMGDDAELQIFVGGLRPFTDHPMSEQDKASVRDHWDHVAEASGQPFDYAMFERDGFVYDTEPACRAIVAARYIDPAAAHPMLNRLHRAFYAENLDVTDPGVLIEIATEIGLPGGDFEIAYGSDEAKQATLGEFQYAQRSHITGFPTLVGITEGETPVMLTMGFQPWEGIAPAIEDWLAGEVPDTAARFRDDDIK